MNQHKQPRYLGQDSKMASGTDKYVMIVIEKTKLCAIEIVKQEIMRNMMRKINLTIFVYLGSKYYLDDYKNGTR